MMVLRIRNQVVLTVQVVAVEQLVVHSFVVEVVLASKASGSGYLCRIARTSFASLSFCLRYVYNWSKLTT
ncbi:hypothetical protein Tco_1395071 [Tanacetum coccineum]